MINFYSYHNGDLHKEEIYKQPMMILEDCGCLYVSVPEVENIIKKVPKWALFHSFYVKKGRWPEAEPYIMKNEMWWRSYKSVFKL